MLPNLERYLVELDALSLDPSDYMISGSGTLAVLGIRDCNDIDVIVLDEAGELLKDKYYDNFRQGTHCDKIVFENVEIMWNFKDPIPGHTSKELMDSSITVQGRRYQNLESIKYFKKLMAREKDIVDIERIEQYEKNHSNK
jgi:hypothetical protein